MPKRKTMQTWPHFPAASNVYIIFQFRLLGMPSLQGRRQQQQQLTFTFSARFSTLKFNRPHGAPARRSVTRVQTFTPDFPSSARRRRRTRLSKRRRNDAAAKRHFDIKLEETLTLSAGHFRFSLLVRSPSCESNGHLQAGSPAGR